MGKEKSEESQLNIDMTCTEISGLWGVYFQESMNTCFLTYFNHHLQDKEIIPLAQEALQISQVRLVKMRQFFQTENFPIPVAFSEQDVNLTAPPLFHDPFALSYIYLMSRLSMISFGFIASNNFRLDVLDFFMECLHTSTDMYGKAVRMLLSKGLYDRPPKMNYPQKIEFVHKEAFLSGFVGKKRPINVIELSEMVFNIERNYFSIIIMLGFAQVMEDKQLKKFILRGKEISEKQIVLFNKLLIEEDLLGMVTVNMEVTASTVSPFSDKLIVSMINILNPVDLYIISHAMAFSMRTDLVAHYSKIIAEVMLYSKDTYDIVVEKGWMEQPPLMTDREQLIHHKS